MPTRKNTPFNWTIIAVLLCLTLFAQSPQMKAASIYSPFGNLLLCHFFHANLWHWAANAFALVLMRPSPKDLTLAFPIASLAMLCTTTPTIGFSAILYAYIGINIIRWKVSLIDWATFIVANLITIFIPNVAFSVHLAAFSLGLVAYTWFTILHSALK